MEGREKSDNEYDGKICELGSSDDPEDQELLKYLAQNSRFICSMCGRSAANEENLCSPEPV